MTGMHVSPDISSHPNILSRDRWARRIVTPEQEQHAEATIKARRERWQARLKHPGPKRLHPAYNPRLSLKIGGGS
jgi:hypothetical protein